MRQRSRLMLAALVLAWSPQATWAQAPCATAAGLANQRVLAEAWDFVGQRFYDPAMHGIDWAGALERHQPRA